MVDQIRKDQPKTPPKVLGKKQARSPSEEPEEVSHPQITHADMRHVNRLLRPQPQVKKQLINRFEALTVEPMPIIPPAKFVWSENDMPRFLGEITEYLEDTEVTSPMRKVMVTLSRMEP